MRALSHSLGGKDDATIRVDLPDGRDMLVTYTGAPIRTEDGEITGYVALGRDVTAQWQAQEALRRAHDELEQRVAERTHELALANTECDDSRDRCSKSRRRSGMLSRRNSTTKSARS